MTEDNHNDLYEKIGALAASQEAMRGDITEIKADGKATREEISKLNWTMAKWSGGLAVIVTVGVEFIKDYLPWTK